ncbi:transporter [Undibacterium sp. Di24W]|uniref:transporter n=1 Tax=Undibacterium sp. Di24W TaxID=3413033 RepID=UPI003BEFDE3E
MLITKNSIPSRFQFAFGLASILVSTLASTVVYAQENTDAISPYRPSVSSPALLPLAGQLEFELGLLRVKQDELRRDSLPYLFKLAFSKEWGVLVGGEAQVVNRIDRAPTQRGFGDFNLVLKRAFLNADGSAFGIELGSKIATAKEGIGSGKNDFVLNGIYSRDLDAVHMDLNVNLTHLGSVEAGSSSLQKAWSASFSTPINDKWGITGEVSGTLRSGSASTAQTLLALTYSPHNRLTIDFGVVKGLNKGAPDYTLFSGFVIPVAKLF